MRRFLTLVSLLCLALPAGVSISGCIRNPAGNYCNGLGYGLKNTDVASITLQPQATGISLAFGQTQQAQAPFAVTCLGGGAIVNTKAYVYATTNNRLVDISPSGEICAGTWNRNTGGGIADYTYCNFPNPMPSTNGLPYGQAFISASLNSVTSNPVAVYIHAAVTSVALVGPQQCLSQGVKAQLDAQACFTGTGSQQQLLCAPAGTTSPACPLPAGQTLASIPNCSAAIGPLSYLTGNSTIGNINSETNQITAEQPGTTAITASVAGSGSSAGYFSTCPPQSIRVTLANGTTSGTITKGVQQNLTTAAIDSQGNALTGLNLDYQSTNPIDISIPSAGNILSRFPGASSVYAICQPSSCNPAPINEIGLYGTGLSISSNPVTVTTPGTASQYLWFAAPGQSQYFVPIELLTGTVGSTVRLPYVPNSMAMDQGGTNLYFGSSRELMVYSTTNNSIERQDNNVPGVVLAVSPNNTYVLINDQARKLFYLYLAGGGSFTTQGGMGTSAFWTPDSRTLYISDTSSANNPALGITGHTDTLYVYNQSFGWSTYALPPPSATWLANQTARSLAVTIPGVGAYLSGNPTVANTWCPSGIVGNSSTVQLYPVGDIVPAQTDVVAATSDGAHILGAAMAGGGVTLTDIGVTVPTTACSVSNVGGVQTMSPMVIPHTLYQAPLTQVNATSVNQVVTSPATNLAFVTYNGTAAGGKLPYFIPGAGGAAGTLSYITLSGGVAVTAPVAGAFSPDNTLFFVSTTGDNKIHYINLQTLTDTQQISPGLPACNPVTDAGCLATVPSGTIVPATVITVLPRSTT